MDNLSDKLKGFNVGVGFNDDDKPSFVGDGDEPPELPVKLRKRTLKISLNRLEENARPPSHYDNISDHLDSNSTHTSMSSVTNNTIKYDLSTTWQASNQSISCPMHLSSQANSGDTSSRQSHSNGLEDSSKPPPLPPKRRNIMTYMQMVGSYCGPNDAALNLYRHSVHTYHSVYSPNKYRAWQQVETTCMQQRSLGKGFISTIAGSEDSIISFESGSDSSHNISGHRISTETDDTQTPPSLPPKKKSQVKQYQEKFEPEIETSTETQPRPTSSPISLVPSSESGISSQSESIRASDEDGQGPLDEMDVSPYLVYKNPGDNGPEIRGGPVDVLIVKATEVSKNDFLFQEAFLATYRTFISPMELTSKLLYRYNKFTNNTDSKQRAAKNSFALLVRVVDELCVNECSDMLMQSLLEFIYQLVTKGDLTLARALRSKVIEKFDNRRNGLPLNQVLLPSVNISAKCWTLHDFKSEIIAEQMTLLDAGLFQKVEVAEYLLWAREQKEELIPNLNKFTEHFNKMSYWVRSRIVEIEDPKEREKLVLKFIKIMKHLRKMNNFNSYLAVLSALDSGPVRRLEWPKSITEALKDYCSLIDSSSSFRTYRQALAETQPPCIPYIGLILQDLTFVHIGNSDYIQDSDGTNINFAKCWQIFNILDQMRRFRNSHYPFKTNEQALSYFNDFENYLSEEAIWQISEFIKPRGGGSGSSSNNNTNQHHFKWWWCSIQNQKRD